jgi:hypothetical protein
MRHWLLVIALAVPAASAQDWRGQLKMIENDLRTQHYGHARKWSIKMINSMCEHLGTGPDSMYTLALTVAYRSMAEAGLEKFEDADWYWHVALALYPKLAKNDWKTYGEAGEWVASHKDDLQTTDSRAIPIRKREPKCPLSAIKGGYFQPVTVAAIIDGEGNARCPRLVSSTIAPTLIYAALESLKEFEFQPGPAANYELTVNFQPPRP